MAKKKFYTGQLVYMPYPCEEEWVLCEVQYASVMNTVIVKYKDQLYETHTSALRYTE